MATSTCILCGAGACSCRGEASVAAEAIAAEAVAITAISRAATASASLAAATLTMLNPTLYTADRRLCLNAQGQVVEADDDSRVSLLVPEGGVLPYERALALGLLEAEAEAESVSQEAHQEAHADSTNEIATTEAQPAPGAAPGDTAAAPGPVKPSAPSAPATPRAKRTAAVRTGD